MPARLFLSSGDLVADRRFVFSPGLHLPGEFPPPPDLFFQAARAAPRFCSPPVSLGGGPGPPAGRRPAGAVDHFIGIDLSPGMIEKARATGLYAQLEVAEMVEALRGKPDASADLVLAADAMVYLSDLEPLLCEVTRVLAAGGLLAFTLE